MKIMQIYDKFRECGSVATDSRTLNGGEMFFALNDERSDGSDHAVKALQAGAAYAVVNASSEVVTAAAEGRLPSDISGRLVVVDDTLKTLQELARWHRSMTFVDGKPLTVIALAGMKGKTSAKELIRKVLSVKYNVTATEGGLDDSVGVPLTLLKIDSQTQIAVVEMGASHPGGIKELVDIALPNYGLITDVDKDDLVMSTNGELYDYLRRTSDMVFLNVDDPCLCRMASERNLQSDPERPYSLLIPYGVEYQECIVIPSDDDNPYLRISHPEYGVIGTNLVGTCNVCNVMAAIAVGSRFGVSLEDAAKAVGTYVP